MFLLSPPLTSSVPQLQGLQLAWLNGTHTCTLLDLPGRIITGYYRGAGFLGCVIQVQGCTRYSTPSVIILKIKNKKYSFSNKNGCFISRRRRGNVRPVACKIIVFWMFKPFANEREIFFNDGFSFMGHNMDPPPFSGDPVTFRVGQTLWVCSTKWCSSTVLRSSLTFSFLP